MCCCYCIFNYITFTFFVQRQRTKPCPLPCASKQAADLREAVLRLKIVRGTSGSGTSRSTILSLKN